jgi:hypothetical protein
MKILLGAILTLGLIGPASSQLLDPEQEKAASFATYKMCLRLAAMRLDDGKSDASSVGRGLLPSCGAEWQKLLGIYTSRLALEKQAGFIRDVSSTQLDDATEAVLAYRAALHSKGKSSSTISPSH